jgi:alkyldihydroxyacetonephosphate synthase
VRQIQSLVQWARSYQVALIPYGSGTGLAQGIKVVHSLSCMVDLKRMNKVIDIDRLSLQVTAQPGIIGIHLEETLNVQGMTLGHFPTSIMSATLGGFLAARSAGQKSSLYGKIEDRLLRLQFVDGRGKLHQTQSTLWSKRPDFNALICGSEGTLGVITQATLRINRTPPRQRLRSFVFRDLASAMEAVREMIQCGLRPSIVRLYDELESLLASQFGPKKNAFEEQSVWEVNWDKTWRLVATEWLKHFRKSTLPLIKWAGGGCRLYLAFEGFSELVHEEEVMASSCMLRLGGVDEGRKPAELWYANRYGMAFAAPRLIRKGFWIETVEVAVGWDHAGSLYRDMGYPGFFRLFVPVRRLRLVWIFWRTKFGIVHLPWSLAIRRRSVIITV